MPTEPYQRKLVRDLAMRMIYLDHAITGARRRDDWGKFQQLTFQRQRCQTYRSALLRQLWVRHRQEEEHAEEQALCAAGV